MERLTIDEIIAHCKRRVRREESLNGRDFFETELMGHYHMQEYWEHRQVAEYLEELKEYRKAEEQGLLLRLPCRVGDTVYVINRRDNLVTEEKVRDVQYRGESYQKGKRFFMNIGASIFFEDEFGKLVFFDREEAKSALAKKGGVE